MKIFVVEFVGHGGMFHYAYQMCDALSKKNVDVTLITDSDFEFSNLKHNFKIKNVLKLWNPKSSDNQYHNKIFRTLRTFWRGIKYYREWIRLILLLRKERPDFIQFGEIRFITDYFPLKILKSTGFSLCDICHNVVPFEVELGLFSTRIKETLYKYFYKKIYNCFNIIFVHSESNKNLFNKIYNYDLDNSHIIPHGNENIFLENGNLSKPDDYFSEKFNISQNSKVALFFGTISKYKGLEYLIEAFPKVLQQLPDSNLIIAGFPHKDVDIESIINRTKELGISQSVVFYLQYVPKEEIRALFTLASVIVLPYIMIYQSGVLQLAYSFSKAVVATDVGDMPEVLKHEETGLLVPPCNLESLSKAIIRLLSDSSLAYKLGSKGKEYSDKSHSWDNVSEKLFNLYSKHIT